MGMSSPQGGGQNQPMSEINVTPFVDVMLVLLVIFMIASGVESVEVEEELQRLRQESNIEEVQEKTDIHPSQKVPVDLPKVNSEKVNLSEEQKLVLSLKTEMDFFIGDTKILSCPESRAKGRGEPDAAAEAAFKKCLVELEQKLLENQKLREDQEMYLRADRGIDYGRVLGVMARVRKAGVTKFGLVAEADLEE
jgi:biopolymer transport protein TolR